MKSEIQKAKERAALALKDASESQLQKNRGYMVASNQIQSGQGHLMVQLWILKRNQAGFIISIYR